ncbi:MAG: cyclase family protein [Planctomycetota bacterium]
MTVRRFALAASVAIVAFALLQRSPATAEPPAPRLGKNDVERMMKELSNWGRWGQEDQLGAINLITPAKRRQAVLLVREGVSVSLARDVETKDAPDNGNPFEHKMLSTGEGEGHWSADNYSVSYHGYAHTHMDSLCHIFHNGKMYNGFSRSEVKAKGAEKLSIRNLKEGILSRGVLVDIPHLKGVKYLEPGTAIHPSDFEAWEKKTGLRIGSGDVVIINTGRWARRDEKGPWSVGKQGAAGLHASCVPWLKKRDIAILGSDAASDVIPSGIEGVSHPVHLMMLHALGVHILDNCDLTAISKACAKRGRWEFLLTMSPLAVPGGTGSPLNPIATF